MINVATAWHMATSALDVDATTLRSIQTGIEHPRTIGGSGALRFSLIDLVAIGFPCQVRFSSFEYEGTPCPWCVPVSQPWQGMNQVNLANKAAEKEAVRCSSGWFGNPGPRHRKHGSRISGA